MQTQGNTRWWRLAGGISLAVGALYAWSVFVARPEGRFVWKRADVSILFAIAVGAFGVTPEPSLAERGRTLAAVGRIGSLATHSSRFAGFPFCSLMPYAADELGRPIFFISSMAMHTRNIAADPRVSLLVAQPDVGGDPLAAARVTLIGRAVETPADEVRELYLSRYEAARYWQDFTDFAYYRVEVEGVYFIGGFGVMGWISTEEYRAAAPDPLADAAPGIIRHMNDDHADALLRIAKRHAGEAAEEASMTAVDRLGFHVRLRFGDRVHGLRIAFPREVTNTEEARRVFVEMSRGQLSPP